MVSPADQACVARYAKHFARPLQQVVADLETYALLLAKWQKIQNLVSRETLTLLWSRHFADSLQTLTLLEAGDERILDLGSGGGFPAIPMAIGSKGGSRQFILVEPTGRKVSFLRTVSRDLDLPVKVISGRAEAIDSRETQPDVITSRALASLSTLCAMSAPLFRPGTRAIFHKGREHGAEIAEAAAHWHFNVLLTPSDTDADAVLVELTDLRSKSSL